jgi:hypothetical protein
MPTVKIQRVQTGDLVGDAVPDCVTGTPTMFTLQDKDDPTIQYVLYACIDHTIPPCDTGGIFDILDGAGYTVTDSGCS